MPGPVAATRTVTALLSFAEICQRSKGYFVVMFNYCAEENVLRNKSNLTQQMTEKVLNKQVHRHTRKKERKNQTKKKKRENRNRDRSDCKVQTFNQDSR